MFEPDEEALLRDMLKGPLFLRMPFKAGSEKRETFYAVNGSDLKHKAGAMTRLFHSGMIDVDPNSYGGDFILTDKGRAEAIGIEKREQNNGAKSYRTDRPPGRRP